jgi:hypothetical protein
LIVGIVSLAGLTAQGAEKKVPITFSGGHETQRQDGGRPIVLIAAGLGVKPEIFREAFSGVTPARNGKPSPEDARKNKAALLKVLKPHGVTNDRLDEVSDYYRYQPQRGDLWKNSPAKAYAIVEDGKIKKIVVTEPGAGYSTPPTAVVQGMEKVPLKVSVLFDQDLAKNGSIRSVALAAP